MRIFLRVLSVPMVAIGVLLVYAVIHAMSSAGGAKAGVSIGYIAGAIILFGLSVMIWRRQPKDVAPRTISRA
jgi:multisubunit Na+/H+ antiporter MnhB subunit